MNLNARLNRIATFFQEKDFWLFSVVLIVISVQQTSYYGDRNWIAFLGMLIMLGMIYLPVLLFAAYKDRLRKRMKPWAFKLSWVFMFGFYPFGWAIASNDWGGDRIYDSEVMIIAFMVTSGLAVLLEINAFARGNSRVGKFLGRIRPDSAILYTLVFLSFFIAFVSMVSDTQYFAVEGMGLNLESDSWIVFVLSYLGAVVQIFLAFMGVYVFYLLHRHFLVARLLQKRGLLFYVFGAVGSLCLLYPLISQFVIWLPLHQNARVLLPSGNFDAFEDENLAVFMIVLIGSLPLILVWDWFQKRNQIVSLEREKAQTELDLLRHQINPHFFFNTLNNLYALSIKQSDQTPEVIMKLSELMRYVIYRGRESLVSISEEVSYLRDYVSLQQIRLVKDLDFQFDVEWEAGQMPPLLLIVFVENAFKHGLEPAGGEGFLHLNLRSDGQNLIFRCENSIPEAPLGEMGVGLSDLKRRLSLLYGKDHSLLVKADENRFLAELWIPLA